MESHLLNGYQQGYLHNVVAAEMAQGVPLPAYVAQAIVSRSYAYNITLGGTRTIDNSNRFEVFVPYYYETKLATPELRKQKVDQAITLPGPLYLSLPDSTEPLLTFFGADNCRYTAQGHAPYLSPVYDPISAKAEDTDGNPTTHCNNADYGTSYGGMGSSRQYQPLQSRSTLVCSLGQPDRQS